MVRRFLARLRVRPGLSLLQAPSGARTHFPGGLQVQPAFFSYRLQVEPAPVASARKRRIIGMPDGTGIEYHIYYLYAIGNVQPFETGELFEWGREAREHSNWGRCSSGVGAGPGVRSNGVD